MRNGGQRSRGETNRLVALTGRLDAAKRAEFSRRAAQMLIEHAARAKTPHCDPPPEHFKALRLLAKHAADLANQYAQVTSAGLSAQFLRDAWRQVDFDGHGRPFPDDLIETLQQLAFAAIVWQPDPQPAHRPTDHSPGAAVVSLLALEYWVLFGEWPRVGNGSPFVRYCREALPEVGFRCPSLDKLTAIVARFR